MSVTSVLGTVWYNELGSSISFTVPVVLAGPGERGAEGPGTRILTLTDDVTSMLDTIRTARPIAMFDTIQAE